MRIAVIGSRSLKAEDISQYLPKDVTEIVSGGAEGIDACARKYAQDNGIRLTEFLPQYERYGRAAPLYRNREIIGYADEVVAIWDGKSHGTKYVIDQCRQCGKPVTVYQIV